MWTLVSFMGGFVLFVILMLVLVMIVRIES